MPLNVKFLENYLTAYGIIIISCMSFFIHYRSAYSHYTTTVSVTSTDIVSLEHIVLTLTLTLENYGTEYDIDDLYDYIYDYYYGRSEDNVGFKDFEYLEEVAKGNTDRDIYDWLGDSHPKRGGIKVELVSPSGTKSTLLPYRKYDFINAEGYDSWPFMSLHYWGEDPIGTWTINVYFQSNYGYVSVHVNSFEFYGTNVIPEAVSRIPDNCDNACAYKCAGAGPEYCDSCRQVRNATTLECLESCPVNFTQYNGYCLDSLTYSSSDDKGSSNFILPVTIAAVVVFLIICIFAFVILCAVAYVLIKRKKPTNSYRMMPVLDDESK